jgi:putative transposase
LFVFIVLQHQRRRILHFGVTANPTSQWTSQQIREAFPWDSAPRYLIRDRDASYGAAFRSRLNAMDITEVLSAPRSPWQNACVERLIGSIRRELSLPKCMARPQSASGLLPVGRKQSAAMYPAHERSPWP